MADMKLLLDVGNSRVKWAFSAGAGLVAAGEASHDAGLGALFDTTHVPREIRLANVAGAELGARLAARLHERFGLAPLVARSAATGAGVRSGYTDPAQLGVDRWLAICAAYARYRSPLCVVDSGTATTVDIVFGGGEHQGGLILPGIALMQTALLGGTGDLARLTGRPGPATEGDGDGGVSFGRDTGAAIRGGALQATACLVRSCLDLLQDRAPPGGTPALLALTGGAAPLLGAAILRMAAGPDQSLAPAFRLEQRPALVLEGLALDPPCFRVAP